MRKNLKIGLFGFGVVGQGLHDVLSGSKGFQTEIVKICVKHPNKKRSLPAHYFTFDKNEILNHPEINLVVELIDDATAAYDIVKTAMINGKSVVTSNKKMLALHLPELIALQEKHNVSLLYEASSCGSIPIIRNLEEYYDNELLYSVRGIFNGSSNYILTKIFEEGLDYHQALRQAQALGFAESDPTLDVEGFDALYKLCIITTHAFGIYVKPDDIFNYGISKMSAFDVKYMKEKSWCVKLICRAIKVSNEQLIAYVMPQFASKKSRFYNVKDEYNGVIVEAAFSDKQFFHGKGAGGHPTGTAVLSDISASSYDYRYEYKKIAQKDTLKYNLENYTIPIYLRYQDESVLQHFELLEIYEKYYSKDYNYLTAKISLAHLQAIKEKLRQLPVFIAQLPEQTQL
jgi:homoserine dehydrogenase